MCASSSQTTSGGFGGWLNHFEDNVRTLEDSTKDTLPNEQSESFLCSNMMVN